MSSDNSSRGKKRSKAFYRKSSYGGKRQCTGRNVLEPGIKGFLVMCHGNESSAVRESYNILNEYGDLVYGPEKKQDPDKTNSADDSEDECEDLEKALKKEVDSIKQVAPAEKRFQNVMTKAKNCVFIRTTLADPVKVVTAVMEDIAQRKLNRARSAARMLPIVGTCKAQTASIAELAKTSLVSYFSKENPDVPSSFTVMFKARNNNTTTCGKESVIPAIKNEILSINPDLKFSWSEFDVAVLVEVVCTVCCLGLAPSYNRLRKYNFQELSQGPKVKSDITESAEKPIVETNKQKTESNIVDNGSIKAESLDETVIAETDKMKTESNIVDNGSIKAESLEESTIVDHTKALNDSLIKSELSDTPLEDGISENPIPDKTTTSATVTDTSS